MAEATILGALQRRETRGAHHRTDHPRLDPALQVNLVARLDGDRLVLQPEPVPPVPDELRSWVEAGQDIAAAGRLLE